ncbi:hypothetical protein P3T27_002455 [Kitasatospora sp. MAA19]|nr:hypothetical protein [Kitasatospora sp. MAA19]MDH6705733.1 hypothetical protein [Kitasatospora sp. MAA19]
MIRRTTVLATAASVLGLTALTGRTCGTFRDFGPVEPVPAPN